MKDVKHLLKMCTLSGIILAVWGEIVIREAAYNEIAGDMGKILMAISRLVFLIAGMVVIYKEEMADPNKSDYLAAILGVPIAFFLMVMISVGFPVLAPTQGSEIYLSCGILIYALTVVVVIAMARTSASKINEQKMNADEASFAKIG